MSAARVNPLHFLPNDRSHLPYVRTYCSKVKPGFSGILNIRSPLWEVVLSAVTVAIVNELALSDEMYLAVGERLFTHPVTVGLGTAVIRSPPVV